MRLKKVKSFGKGHTISKRQSWDLNIALSNSFPSSGSADMDVGAGEAILGPGMKDTCWEWWEEKRFPIP